MTLLTSDPAAEWRRLQGRLWAGRSGGLPIGTIERGRRYAWTDLEGVVHSGFRTLHAAQAFADGHDARRDGASAAVPRGAGRVLLPVMSTVAAAAAALCAVGVVDLLRAFA